MNILLVTEYFPTRDGIVTGGVERRTLELAKQLAKDHEVTVLAGNTVEPNQREIPGVHVVRCGPRRQYTHRGSLAARLLMLFDMYRKGKTITCDIVEASNATVCLVSFFIGLSVRAKRIAWVPDVFGHHLLSSLGVISGAVAFLMERVGLLLSWDHYIALSRQTERKLKGLGIAGGKISVVYGGVDMNVNRDEPASDSRILTVSRLVAYKRVEDTIAALPLVKQKIPDAHLTIVGDGLQKEELIELAKKLEVARSVQFTANLSDSKLWSLIGSAKVYCSTSLVEGFGLSVMEAMARGVPGVISDIETHQEVTGGKGVLFFQPRDPKDLSDKLVDLLTDKRLWYKKSREARQLAPRYSWPHIAAQTLAVYNRAVHKHLYDD